MPQHICATNDIFSIIFQKEVFRTETTTPLEQSDAGERRNGGTDPHIGNSSCSIDPITQLER